MKKIIFASGLLALMVAATSCDKYDIYPEEFEGVFTIKDAGTRELTVYASDATAEVPFIVLKGGYDPEIASSATLKVMDEAEFADYQEISGNVAYARVGNECFSFSPTADEYAVPCKFDSADDRYISATLYVRPRVLKTWVDQHAAELEGKTPVVPVTLVSSENAVDENGKVSIVKLDLRIPALTLDVDAIVPRTVNKKNMSDGDNFYRPEVNFSIPCRNTWGFTLNLVSDSQDIADYNAANGTDYIELPADAYTLKTSYHFAPGTTYMPLDLDIDLNKLQLYKNYALSVAFDKDQPITWDDENNTPGENFVLDPTTKVFFTVIIKDFVELQLVPLSTANVITNDQEPLEGPLEGLFDDDETTFFHSSYSDPKERNAVYGSYLEITLPDPMSRFRFTLANRKSPTAAGYVKTVRLYGTNDRTDWPEEPFAEITDMNKTLNAELAEGDFGSDEEPFVAPESYKYLRFCVMESGGGSLGQTTGAVYWCASKFVLYGY